MLTVGVLVWLTSPTTQTRAASHSTSTVNFDETFEVKIDKKDLGHGLHHVTYKLPAEVGYDTVTDVDLTLVGRGVLILKVEMTGPNGGVKRLYPLRKPDPYIDIVWVQIGEVTRVVWDPRFPDRDK